MENVRLLTTNWTFCIAWLPVQRKKKKTKHPSFDFLLDRQMQASCMKVFALAPFIAYESLCLWPEFWASVQVLCCLECLSLAFFFIILHSRIHRLFSKCPCNGSSVSRFKFSLLCYKGYAIKSPLSRRFCSSVPVCSYALSIDGVFFSSDLKVCYVDDTTCSF